MFSLVSCPHYLAEVLTWFSFAACAQVVAIAVARLKLERCMQVLPALLFAVATLVILCIYARERHLKYRRDYADYPPSRKAIIPFLF